MKTALLVGAIVIGGAGAGFAAERAGLVSPLGEPAVIATLDAVSYSVCPAEPSIGELHRGDRVLATGRNVVGDWVQIRAPYGIGARVWVESVWLTPDSDLEALPGVGCELPEFDAAGESVETTSTTSASASTTAAPTTTTTTTISATTTSTTTTTTTTVPADQEGPVVVFLQSTEGDLWEDAQYGGCPTQQQTAVVSAIVADPSGIASVQLSWSVGLSGETLEMLDMGSDVFSVTIGPFAESTLSLNGGTEPISLTLTAVDLLGNPTAVSSDSLIILHDCVIS